MRTLAIFSAPGMASNRCRIALLNRNEETRLPCGRGRAWPRGVAHFAKPRNVQRCGPVVKGRLGSVRLGPRGQRAPRRRDLSPRPCNVPEPKRYGEWGEATPGRSRRNPQAIPTPYRRYGSEDRRRFWSG